MLQPCFRIGKSERDSVRSCPAFLQCHDPKGMSCSSHTCKTLQVDISAMSALCSSSAVVTQELYAIERVEQPSGMRNSCGLFRRC